MRQALGLAVTFGVGLMAAGMAGWAQEAAEPLAKVEMVASATAGDVAVEGAAAAETPRDPNRGAVTNLPLPRYVSLKTGEGNARRGPGLTHRIDWVFTHAGMPLRITAEYEHWRRVEDFEGVGGWVHYSLLSGVRSVLVSEDMAEFHLRPDAEADVLFHAELGVIGRILECHDDWCRIAVEGEKGWVQSDRLWGVDPGEEIE
jgi:SH3-like domain-containing protein